MPDKLRSRFGNLIAGALLGLFAGCAAPTQEAAFTPLRGESAESQWEVHIVAGGNDTPVTVAMAASRAEPGEGRLYAMLPFGQTLGKCVLSGGAAACEASAPGAGPLAQKAADGMAKMLEADAGDGGMFGKNASGPHPLRGGGWRSEVDGEWLIYREDGAKWTLRMKRIK